MAGTLYMHLKVSLQDGAPPTTTQHITLCRVDNAWRCIAPLPVMPPLLQHVSMPHSATCTLTQYAAWCNLPCSATLPCLPSAPRPSCTACSKAPGRP